MLSESLPPRRWPKTGEDPGSDPAVATEIDRMKCEKLIGRKKFCRIKLI